MRNVTIGILGILLAALVPGCSIDLPENFSPYVVQGTAVSIENNGSAFIWQADDGQVYQLYQTSKVDNQDFDTIITSGTRARLEIQPRIDLGDSFVPGAIIVDVNKVLQINPPIPGT